jgi:hypothetical protein
VQPVWVYKDVFLGNKTGMTFARYNKREVERESIKIKRLIKLEEEKKQLFLLQLEQELYATCPEKKVGYAIAGIIDWQGNIIGHREWEGRGVDNSI